MYIGNRLKQLRIDCGILQKDFAEKLQLSQQTISLYESNKRQPDYAKLRIIAEYFNVSTDYLLGLTDIKETIHTIVENNFNIRFESKENIMLLDILDKIYELSPESQKDVMKYLEMCKLWEKEKKG